MTRRYNYKIFPTTGKARVLLALAFALGALIIAGYIAFYVFIAFGDFLDQEDVTYVNRTDGTIVIYIDDATELSVPAESSVSESYYKIEWWFDRTVSAEDSEGQIIWAERLDKDDLEDRDWRIVIE
jgi:hypothetical protein